MQNCNQCGLKEEIRDDVICLNCRNLQEIYRRFASSNIPIRYWNLNMDPLTFKGHSSLLDVYNKFVGDSNKIKQTYRRGICLKFSGGHGLGKTMTVCNILKQVVLSGLYTALYVSLNDIISHLVYGKFEDKAVARQLLITRDFLVIDELDKRFFGSDAGSDLFARVLEDVFRTRSQNLLPTLICTNSPNIEQSISNPELRTSLESLFQYMENVPLPPGKDLRKNKQ